MFFPLSYKRRVREKPGKAKRGQHEILAKFDSVEGGDGVSRPHHLPRASYRNREGTQLALQMSSKAGEYVPCTHLTFFRGLLESVETLAW